MASNNMLKIVHDIGLRFWHSFKISSLLIHFIKKLYIHATDGNEPNQVELFRKNILSTDRSQTENILGISII